MRKKKFLQIFFVNYFNFSYFLFVSKFYKKEWSQKPVNKEMVSEEIIYNSNIINNVLYTTKDANGNEYDNCFERTNRSDSPNILYLTDVEALIN